mgnify:CR=1 FL=1
MTTTISNDKVSITTEYNTKEIWNAFIGSDFANTNHWISTIGITDHLNTSTINEPTDLTIRYLEPTSGADSLAVVTPNEIYLAFAQLVIKKQTHCGGYPITDLDNSDACFADFVLQQALFNDIVFS